MATLKSMIDDTPRLCTIIDVVSKFPKIVAGDINLDESDSTVVRYEYLINQSIIDASQEIIASLLPIYISESNLEATAPWVGIIISNKTNDDPKARLRICQAGADAITEMFMLTFSSSTNYTATGYLTGGLGTGTISTNFTSSGEGDLVIPAADATGLFSGTFAGDDKVFISINKWNRMLATICTYKATADALRSIFFESSINDETNLIAKLSNHAKRELEKLQKPDVPDGSQLSTLPSRDLSDQTTGDWDQRIFDIHGTPDTSDFMDDDLDSYSE